jgi:hypothetical protein
MSNVPALHRLAARLLSQGRPGRSQANIPDSGNVIGVSSVALAMLALGPRGAGSSENRSELLTKRPFRRWSETFPLLASRMEVVDE